MTSSPISSGAKAFRKGLSQKLKNDIESNLHSAAMITKTKSRAVNYRNMLQFIEHTYRGMIALKATNNTTSRKKQRTDYIVIEAAENDDEDICLNTLHVTFRDPINTTVSGLPIKITKHALERMSQRADSHILQPILGVVFFHPRITEDGIYEVGCKTGMMLVDREDDLTTAITFVDADKLRPDQPIKYHDFRKIRERGC